MPLFDLLSTSDLWFASQNIPAKVFDKIDSTTTAAKSEALKINSALAVYISGFQTAGRGRDSNTWSAEPGESFLSSWSFAIDSHPQPILAALVGLALFEAATEVWPKLPFSLKAPNDIYLGSKKIIGILIEVVEGEAKRLIISFGFNLFGSPAEVSTATSLIAEHPEFSAQEWKKFLSHAVVKLRGAIKAGSESLLSKTSCANLCKALNSNPNLIEKFIAVEPNGSLRSKDKLIPWQDL